MEQQSARAPANTGPAAADISPTKSEEAHAPRHVSKRRAVDHSAMYVAKSLFAGGIAGCVAKTAVAPFDRIKILFQGHNSQFLQERGKFSGAFTAFQRIAKDEGMRGLFKGHSAMLARIFPYAALNYMCFEQFKKVLLPRDQPLFTGARLIAGSLAGTVAVLVTYPLDMARARYAFQVKSHRYSGVVHLLRTMVKEEGYSSLYRGFTPTMLGILPYAGISFYTYDTLKHSMMRAMGSSASTPDGTLKVPLQLLAGAVAGAAAQTSAYPLDVVRRRMQLKGMARNVPHYTGTTDAFRSIVRSEGWRGLFVGLSINYIKVMPATALSFATYEYMKKIFHIQ